MTLGFDILSNADGAHRVPVVACRLNPTYQNGFDELLMARELEKKGWPSQLSVWQMEHLIYFYYA
jgi:hypothetical protein